MWLIADPSSYLHCKLLNNINAPFVKVGDNFADYIEFPPSPAPLYRACHTLSESMPSKTPTASEQDTGTAQAGYWQLRKQLTQNGFSFKRTGTLDPEV